MSRPKVTAVKIIKSAGRLDGATDLLLSCLVDGQRRTVAMREGATHMTALWRDETHETKTLVLPRRVRKSAEIADLLVHDPKIALPYTDYGADSRYWWALHHDDEEERIRLDMLTSRKLDIVGQYESCDQVVLWLEATWDSKSLTHVDYRYIHYVLLIKEKRTRLQRLPRGRTNTDGMSDYEVTPISLTSTGNPFAVKAPTRWHLIEQMSRYLDLSPEGLWFADEARIAFEALTNQCGRIGTPCIAGPRDWRPIAEADVIEEWKRYSIRPSEPQSVSLVHCRHENLWVALETDGAYFGGHKMPPRIKFAGLYENTWHRIGDDFAPAISRLLRHHATRLPDLTETAARVAYLASVNNDIDWRLQLEDKEVQVRDTALVGGFAAVLYSVRWIGERIAPPDAVRPEHIIYCTDRDFQWCLSSTGEPERRVVFSEEADPIFDLVRGGALTKDAIFTLRRQFRGFTSAAAADGAWNVLTGRNVGCDENTETKTCGIDETAIGGIFAAEPVSVPATVVDETVVTECLESPVTVIGTVFATEPDTVPAATTADEIEITENGGNLVTEIADASPAGAKRGRGRPRIHGSDAARVAAWRERKRVAMDGTPATKIDTNPDTEIGLRRGRGRPRVHESGAARVAAWRDRHRADPDQPIGQPGRPRKWSTDAERRAAWRERERAKGKVADDR
jgi:hypothetical protein